MNLQQVAGWLNAECESRQTVSQFVIDSRCVSAGDVFVALPGEHLHGHHFIAAAAAKGAIAAITDKIDARVAIPQFVVADGLQALTTLAKKNRQQFACPVIALTGSNGKTSVKEMIYSALPKPALATAGNFNNHLGVPLSLLKLRPEHRYAVFELGANHLGEIAQTAALVRPDVALINNIAPAHIEGFGSIDNVAKAKGEIYASLSGSGIAIVNEDDDYHHFWDEALADNRVIRFSSKRPSDVSADEIRFDDAGRGRFTLNFQGEALANIQLAIPGRHVIANALAAASCLLALDIDVADIRAGLNQFRGVAGRFSQLLGEKQSLIIDDSYNANLGSTRSAIETLAQLPGTRILIMGDMAELGQWADEHHRQVGELARQHKLDQVLTIGRFAEQIANGFGRNARHFTKMSDLIDYAHSQLGCQVRVLIKGSRSARMERVVKALCVAQDDCPSETQVIG